MPENELTIAESNELIDARPMPQTVSMWNNTTLFNQTYKMAGMFAASDLVPPAYKGNVSNCMIAIDIANRMGLSPITITQNSQIVKGHFTWTGSACKSMIDSCGKYRKTRYVEVGKRGEDDWGFYLEAEDRDGNIINGVTVTLGMAKAEGWTSNPKWRSMPELMMKYRCASFFMRTECASLSMGFLTAEEVEDIPEREDVKKLLETGE